MSLKKETRQENKQKTNHKTEFVRNLIPIYLYIKEYNGKYLGSVRFK